MFRDDDISELFRKRITDLLRKFADEHADYGDIRKKVDEMASIFPGHISFGGVKIEGDNITFFGDGPPEEIMKRLSKVFGDRIFSQLPIIYEQEKKSLIIRSTIDVIKENDQYRVVAELGSLYSPKCKHRVKSYPGGLTLELECKKEREEMELSGNIDLRERLEDGYYDGRFNVLKNHITNSILEVLVKKA